MDNLRKRFSQLPEKNRQTFIVFMAVGLAGLLLSIYLLGDLMVGISNRNTNQIITDLTPFLIVLAGFVGAFLTWRGDVQKAGLLFLSALQIGLLLTSITTQGLALITVSASLLLGGAIIVLTFSKEWAPRAYPAITLVSAAILLIEFFWPFERSVVSSRDLPTITIVVVVLIFIYFVVVSRSFNQFSLRVKLLQVFLLVSLAPVGFVAYFQGTQAYNTLTELSNQTLLQLAGQIASVVDGFLRNGLDNIGAEAQIDLFSNYLSLSIERRADAQEQTGVRNLLITLSRRDAANIVWYALLDTQGRVVMDSLGSLQSMDFSGQEFYKQPLRAGLPYLSSVLVSSEYPNGALHFSAPVRDDSGKVIGVLVARYTASVLQQIAVSSIPSMQTDVDVALLSEDLVFLAHTSQPDLLLKTVAVSDPKRVVELQNSGKVRPGEMVDVIAYMPALVTGLATVDDQPNFPVRLRADAVIDYNALPDEQAGVVRLTTQPWVVVAAQSTEILYAPVNIQTRNTLLLSLALVGLVVVAALFMARYFARPILQLTDAARQMAAGDLSVEAQVTSKDEIGDLTAAFNTMATQLRAIVGDLEQRVENRTRALATSAEVSRRLSTILDQQQLLVAVVEEIQRAFGYYHAHIYLLDESSENLVLAGGTGEAAQTMLLRQHKVPYGKGVVGRAAEIGQAVLVEDTAQDPGWLPNPLLPETKSEAAVPIMLGDRVLGVLDVQQNVVNGLGEQDVQLLQSIANQVAVAVQNARVYTMSQQQAERETLINLIGRRIQSAQTIEDVLRVAVQELHQVTGARRASIQISAPGDRRKGGSGAASQPVAEESR